MAAPMKAGLPYDLHLASGYQVVLTALDAAGNLVANVQLSGVAFFVTDLLNVAGTASPDAPMPLLVPVQDGA